MTIEEKARAYDAMNKIKPLYEQAKKDGNPIWSTYEYLIPQLAESEDEKIRKALVWHLKADVDFVSNGVTKEECIAYLEKQEKQKTIAMEVYEVGKGTTICGQDYRCKKDYKEGNCWYIKNVIYHCSRDGYLNDQNGVSWSCTPEWFKEYIQSNTEWAEEEKNRFVSGQFLQCKLSFDGFKEGEHYWLEYIGDDMYVGRSDNILNQKFHITPRQLYTLFSEKLEEVQGSPQEEKQVSLNYEPPFDENPSDKEIIEALIHHLNEQDGFLTAINCVSTKAILSWLKKQKEQKPCWNPTEEDVALFNKAITTNASLSPQERAKLDILRMKFKHRPVIEQKEQKPAEWSEEDEKQIRQIERIVKDAGCSVKLQEQIHNWLKSLKSSWKPTDEQIKAIRLARSFVVDDFSEKPTLSETLKELEEQLKKLM